MKHETTKERILTEAVKLFSKEGYEAVSVDQIAKAVGIKAPSLYKHYKNKRDIFDSILRRMEQQDGENARACALPEGTAETMPEAYERASVTDLITFSKQQFRYWTEDEFASSFRKLLTVEQYRSEEMQGLYQQYLGAGPLQYVADLLGSETEALAFYGPMHLLYSVYDNADDKAAAYALLDAHLERWHI
ncbi:MAG: TetR/AcrR family transcriptional regulator [Oscillospiraceae bacterium]